MSSCAESTLLSQVNFSKRFLPIRFNGESRRITDWLEFEKSEIFLSFVEIIYAQLFITNLQSIGCTVSQKNFNNKIEKYFVCYYCYIVTNITTVITVVFFAIIFIIINTVNTNLRLVLKRFY